MSNTVESKPLVLASIGPTDMEKSNPAQATPIAKKNESDEMSSVGTQTSGQATGKTSVQTMPANIHPLAQNNQSNGLKEMPLQQKTDQIKSPKSVPSVQNEGKDKILPKSQPQILPKGQPITQPQPNVAPRLSSPPRSQPIRPKVNPTPSKPNPVPIQPRVQLKPLAPKQLLPKILPLPSGSQQNAHHANANTNTHHHNVVNTSKQWVLPPRPRPGRKSGDVSHASHGSPSSVTATTATSTAGTVTKAQDNNNTQLPPTAVKKEVKDQDVIPNLAPKTSKKQAKTVISTTTAAPAMKKTTSDSVSANENVTVTKSKKSAKDSDAKGEKNKENFELKLQLQSATEENENLRKIIEKLNREIDLLRLVKLERKQKLQQYRAQQGQAQNQAPVSNNVAKPSIVDQLPSVPEENPEMSTTSRRRLNELTSTIDPVKINYNLKSKRLKRFNSESGYHSGRIGLNGNSLDDAGFYNADSLMPLDLLLNRPNDSTVEIADSSLNLKAVALDKKTKSVPGIMPNDNNMLNLAVNSSGCGFCSNNGGPCICYESALELFETHDSFLPNFERVRVKSTPVIAIKNEEKDMVIPELGADLNNVGTSNMGQSKLSRTTDIIGNLGKNFIKNEMDVDMSFFVKPEEQDNDDFMMM